MTMTVLATTTTPTTAKVAGKGKHDAKGVDFAALLESSTPGVADLAELLAKANGKGKAKGKDAADVLALLAAQLGRAPTKAKDYAKADADTTDATDGTETPGMTPDATADEAALAAAALALATREKPETSKTTVPTSEEATTVMTQPATTVAADTSAQTAEPATTPVTLDDGTPMPDDVARLIEKLVKGEGKAAETTAPAVATDGKDKPAPQPHASEQGVAHAAAPSAVARAQMSDNVPAPRAPTASDSVAATGANTDKEPSDKREGERSPNSDTRGAAFGLTAPVSGSASSAPSFSQAVSSLPISGAVGAALGQQVVDMGVSGQWLDSIAQQISAVVQSGGQGRFTMDAPQLGPVQVHVTPGDTGTNVHLTVQSDSAFQALSQESDRLIRDAQLSSVRIADLRIERAPQVAEARHAEMSGQNQQQSQGQSSGNAAQFSFNQQGGQRNAFTAQDFGHSAGQGAGQNNSQRGVKDNGAAAVIRQEGPANADTSGEGRRARYA